MRFSGIEPAERAYVRSQSELPYIGLGFFPVRESEHYVRLASVVVESGISD